MFRTIILITVTIGLVTVQGRNINNAGLNMIKKYEGFRANFYLDPVGIKTIGYGHACHVSDCSKIKAPLSEAKASQLLRNDLTSYQNCVQGQVPSVNDNQFAALVSFTYNMGCGAFKSSTLVNYLKKKNYSAAANEFGKWVRGGGKVLPGLVRRRAEEKALFLKR